MARIAKKSKGVNLYKIDRMACLAFQNAMRLHKDSVLLFKNRRYPSAFFLSVVALEELGKMYLLEDFLWHSRMDGRFNDMADDESREELGEDLEASFIEDIYYHPPKQKWFLNNAVTLEDCRFSKRRSKLYRAIYSNELYESECRKNNEHVHREESLKKYQRQFRRANLMERLKQNSIYVGFDRKGKKINLKGKIKTPFAIKRKRALDQITYVSDFFIARILGLVKEVYATDSWYLESFVKKAMADELSKLWRYRKAGAIRQLKRIRMAK